MRSKKRIEAAVLREARESAQAGLFAHRRGAFVPGDLMAAKSRYKWDAVKEACIRLRDRGVLSFDGGEFRVEVCDASR